MAGDKPGRPAMFEHDHGMTRIPDPEELAGTEALMLAGDVLTAEDIAEYPEIKKLCPKHQAIMCAYSCGYGLRFIAKMFDMQQPNVVKLINRIDPARTFKVGAAAKKAFLQRIAESRAAEALSSITPEKLEASTAKELAGIGKDMMSIAGGLSNTKHKEIGSSKLDSLLEAVENERLAGMKQAEIVEEK